MEFGIAVAVVLGEEVGGNRERWRESRVFIWGD